LSSLTDCDNSGDFQSITHNIISRNRRSADYQYSYSEDKPSTSGGNAAPTSHQTERHLYEERIDGLEHAIDKFSQLILSLQDKVRKFNCSSIQSCQMLHAIFSCITTKS